MRPLHYPLKGHLYTRRSFVIGSASFAAAALASSCRVNNVVAAAPKLPGYPFALGVASGDPEPESVVIWTRLAPRSLEIGGGMPPSPVEVTWDVAEDERMTRIVRSGKAIANPAWAHSVHVEVGGLRPDRWYWYRFRAAGDASPTGRTRTMPAANTLPERLRFAFVSCQKYEVGHFTAFDHL
jgi:alkaline phosphatase D